MYCYVPVCAADDVKSKAVNEMMERIKHGVVLRPVKSKDSKVWGRFQYTVVHRL